MRNDNHVSLYFLPTNHSCLKGNFKTETLFGDVIEGFTALSGFTMKNFLNLLLVQFNSTIPEKKLLYSSLKMKRYSKTYLFLLPYLNGIS